MKRLADFVRVMRFRLALIEGDRRLRERIEAAISIHLKNQPDPVGSFQDEGVRYRPRRPSETAIQGICRTNGVILGLPASLEA